ncbi:Dystrophin, isoform B [Melipona quadrifasciata]|uniref:Dystrophin, isoform B n=1 Tax=Melipona quadrifasciata TaxID=166423 RepID=A0A0M8ZV97_9HYME|nr:Dystrophin, isoform B [Melipona quadrifasciata]
MNDNDVASDSLPDFIFPGSLKRPAIVYNVTCGRGYILVWAKFILSLKVILAGATQKIGPLQRRSCGSDFNNSRHAACDTAAKEILLGNLLSQDAKEKERVSITTCSRHKIPSHRRGSIHTGSPVPGHPATNTSIPSSHEVQTRGIPLPGMVPSRSIHGNPMHGNPIHGFVNPLGPAGLVHSPPTHQSVLSGISHHSPVVHQGVEKIQPPGSPYSSHGSPLRTPMSSGHGTPQDSPHVARHRRDSEHSSGVGSRRGSSDVVSPLPEGPSGSPDARARRRSDYSPHQAEQKEYELKLEGIEVSTPLIFALRFRIGSNEEDLQQQRGHFSFTLGPVRRHPVAKHPAHALHHQRYTIESTVSAELSTRVTKLREHWDEMNSKMMQRKTELDAMLGDSQRYEAKRNEVEVWLARMETRLEKMRAVGHTADVLEAQLREQKSFHAELHQYKHQIEQFNQLTQKLIAVYQEDDTTRVKKMTETINQRYNNLNTSIINRGKLLHSAMNSLHNFDRSLDKFLAWLSEAESSMEGLEAEADRLGGRRDQGALRRPQHQLKRTKF